MVDSDRYPSAEDFLNQARETTGLDDFGEGNFRIGLDHMLTSLEGEARLSPADREKAIETISRRLTNRLRVEEYYRIHPEIVAEQVGGPSIVTGLTRTGSTALGNTLSLDPQFRSLRWWEQLLPVLNDRQHPGLQLASAKPAYA